MQTQAVIHKNGDSGQHVMIIQRTDGTENGVDISLSVDIDATGIWVSEPASAT